MILPALCLTALFGGPAAWAQHRVTVSGHISDSASGETLIGAGLVEGASRQGAVTNNFGYYTLTLPAGEYDFQYSYVGYQDQVLHLDLRRDTVVNVALKAGESRRVEVEIPVSELAFFGADGTRKVGPGDFQLWVAGDSASGEPLSFSVR